MENSQLEFYICNEGLECTETISEPFIAPLPINEMKLDKINHKNLIAPQRAFLWLREGYVNNFVKIIGG